MYGAVLGSKATGTLIAVAQGMPDRISTLHEALMLPSKHVPQFQKT
jgi:hypothetical protein